MVKENDLDIEIDKESIDTQIYVGDDSIVSVDDDLLVNIDSVNLFTPEELVLEHNFSSVESFNDLSLYLEGIEDKFGVDFPDFSSGSRENIIVSTNDASQVMVFDSETPTTAIITGGNEIKAGTVSGDVALFITGGDVELDLVGGTTTAFVENLSETYINLKGSNGDIVLSVLGDGQQEGEYSFKEGQLFRGDQELSVFFEDIENFTGNLVINDVQTNSVQIIIEGEQRAFDGMEEGLRDFFVVSDEGSDVIIDNDFDDFANQGITLEIDETFKDVDFGELGDEIFASNEIAFDTTNLENLSNLSNTGEDNISSVGNVDTNSLSATEELLAEYENGNSKTDPSIEVDVKLEQQTEEVFDDFLSSDVVSAFINDDAIDIILDE